MKTEEVKDLIGATVVSKRNDVYTARRSFFYSHGGTAQKFADRIKAAIPSAFILDQGEVWKDFKGGAPVAKQSHWWVKFTLN